MGLPLSQNQRRLVKAIQSIQYLHRQVVTRERKNIVGKVGNLYTYLAPSRVCDGVGVFALTTIPESFTIWPVTKEQISKHEWSSIPKEIHSHVESLTFCNEEAFWLDCDLDRMYAAYYVNHSNNANVRLGELGEYITTRVIQKDEEILFNYPLEHQIWK